LKGTALDIYRLILKTKKPLGIREVQRVLKLSSPSVAHHHLSKLERAGFVKRENGSYVVNRVMLENCIKISRFLIPRYFFYTLFAVFVLVFQLTILKPGALSPVYVFSVSATIIFLLSFCFETIRIWLKGSL
jgi:hypothetical protein